MGDLRPGRRTKQRVDPAAIKEMERSKRVHFLALQGGRCFYCGEPLDISECTIDEVLPRALGGRRHIGNQVAACESCNGKKGCRPPTENELARARALGEAYWLMTGQRISPPAPPSKSLSRRS